MDKQKTVEDFRVGSYYRKSEDHSFIRSGEGEKGKVLSECGSHSDWGEVKKARGCLNVGVIRTGQEKKSKELSESSHHSDRPRQKKEGAV